MLDLGVTVDGTKVVIEGLGKLKGEMRRAAISGLERSAVGIHREAFEFLSGAGAKGMSKEITGKTGKTYFKWERQSIPAGGYPVPVRKGNLRRLLDWLKPGESKTGSAGTFKAEENEVVIYDSAIYADVIHEGRGSSAKFGPRRYMVDALQKFNRGAAIRANIEDEIRKVKGKAGL